MSLLSEVECPVDAHELGQTAEVEKAARRMREAGRPWIGPEYIESERPLGGEQWNER